MRYYLFFLLVGASCWISCQPNAKHAAAAVTGRVLLANTAGEQLASKPNAVCYLILKDPWEVPVAMKRWVNPQFPLVFRLTQEDRLVPSRQWKGPLYMEAYLFESRDSRSELPPPSGALRASVKEAIDPRANHFVEVIFK